MINSLYSLELNHKKLHRDVFRKLNAIGKPQRYLNNKVGISGGTVSRLLDEKDLKLSSLLKLMSWLDADINNYLIRKTNGCKK